MLNSAKNVGRACLVILTLGAGLSTTVWAQQTKTPPAKAPQARKAPAAQPVQSAPTSRKPAPTPAPKVATRPESPRPTAPAPSSDLASELAEAATANTPTAGFYELKYKFQTDEVLRTEVVHRATVETTIQGTNQTAETRSSSIKVWKVSEVADNRIVFEHSVESIDMWQHMKGRQEVTYNSRTDTDAPPGYQTVADAVGKPLTRIAMDERGKILQRDELRPQPSIQAAPLTMQLPDKAVEIGYEWSTPQEIEVRLESGVVRKIQTRQKYKLEKVVDDLATILLDTQVLTPVNDPVIEAQLIQRLSTGSIKFDLTEGRVIGQQLDLDRRVLGFSGPSSSMHYLTRVTETLLPAEEPEAATARRPAATKR